MPRKPINAASSKVLFQFFILLILYSAMHLQLMHGVRMKKKVLLENVEAKPSSISWGLPRKRRKYHGARCNNVHHLQETNLCQMFCWHFKNNLHKMQRVFNPLCLKHLGLENKKKGLHVLFPNFSKCASCRWYLYFYYCSIIMWTAASVSQHLTVLASSYMNIQLVVWLSVTPIYVPSLKYCIAMHFTSTTIK